MNSHCKMRQFDNYSEPKYHQLARVNLWSPKANHFEEWVKTYSSLVFYKESTYEVQVYPTSALILQVQIPTTILWLG
jgi:hypothetical protein